MRACPVDPVYMTASCEPDSFPVVCTYCCVDPLTDMCTGG